MNNRIWLFLCFLCIPWAARGQSAYEWRYWFDEAKNQQQTGQGSGAAFSISADAATLSEGMHTIHVQIADDKGRFSPPQSQLFYRLGNRSAERLRYWFDNDLTVIEATSIEGHHATLDVNHLEPGLHTVCCQVEDAMGNVSNPESRMFYRPMRAEAAKLSYWFDDDREARQTISCPDGPVLIDVSDLADGFHTIYQQVSENTPSAVVSRWFIKIPQTESAADMTCICTVDEKLVGQQRVPASGGVISWNLDVNALPVGLHRAVFQVITASGAASTIAERFFVRAMTSAEMGKMQCLYMLDNSQTHSQAGTMTNGLFHFDLDVASLEDGLHRIAYTLVSEKGDITPQQTAFFWKIPLGGNGIVQYDYWLNDDEDNKRSIHLDKRENPFRLISLLPVDAQPIRTSNFHFEVRDGQPTIYAKNDFHIRFYDNAGRALSETREFVDFQVEQKVTEITPINSGEQKSVDVPAENAIHWFSFDAAPGDTLAFRCSQATSIQVFTPDGDEIYSASGSESVVYGGCHTWSLGKHYLALHDVTGSKPTITLDYFHMDRYDVVKQDVHVVGNGGCSTITVDGNGFRDLYTVDLFTAQGDSIHHVDIGHESDARTSVTFDFSNAILGVYDAVFHFTTEDKVFHNFITVEEARDIELATTVTYHSTFLRGSSTTYTIKIENKGNMTAYLVPMEIKLYIANKANISNLAFNGYLSSLSDIDEFLTDSTDTEIREQIHQIVKASGDLSQFVFFRDSLSNKDVGVSLVLLNVPPNSNRQFTIKVISSSTIEFSAYANSEWYPVFANSPQSKSRMNIRKASVGDWVCCYKDRIECIADVVAKVITTIPGVPPNINCGVQFGNTLAQAVYDIGCSDGGNVTERFRNYAQSKGASLGGKLLANAIDCLTSKIDEMIAPLRKQLRDPEYAKYHDEILNQIQELNEIRRNGINRLIGGVSTFLSGLSCYTAFTTPIPNCPPIPKGGGGSSTPLPPSDPNDIYGYLAESGSKFIADSVEKVNYTIEFENDTTFAMASAHTIVIRDTLDNRFFDLNSFLPTGIKLGGQDVFLGEADVTIKNGKTSFIKTIDVRPAINAIAQVEGAYTQQTGIAEWRFTSLDPMTMEPTDDLMQGILPVNYDGTSGIGEVSFEIGMKQGKADGTEIDNRASIVFDYEDAILTPTWTNIVDGTAPVSRVSNVELASDTIATVSIHATDKLSGPWRYDVYVQYGQGAAWWKAAENIPADSVAMVKIYDGIDHGFCTVLTDMAGNVEQKAMTREATLNLGTAQGDVNGDGTVNVADIAVVVNVMTGTTSNSHADVNGDGTVNVADIAVIVNIMTDKSREKQRLKD